MKKYFISKEFDEKLRKALEMYNKVKMDELDEKMKHLIEEVNSKKE